MFFFCVFVLIQFLKLWFLKMLKPAVFLKMYSMLLY